MSDIVKHAQEAFTELAGNATLTQTEMLEQLSQRIADKVKELMPPLSSISVSTFVNDEALVPEAKWGCTLNVSFPLALPERTEN